MRSKSLLRCLPALVILTRVSLCHAMLAAPAGEDLSSRIDLAIAQRQSLELRADATKQSNDRALAAQKSNLESLRGTHASAIPRSASIDAPKNTNRLLATAAAASALLAGVLLVFWQTRRAMNQQNPATGATPAEPKPKNPKPRISLQEFLAHRTQRENADPQHQESEIQA